MPNENDDKIVTLADLGVAYNNLNTNKKNIQTTVSSPTVDGATIDYSFIDSISQNAQGVIWPTKKRIPEATTSIPGLMSSTDKTKLNSIAAGAAVASVNGTTGAVVLDADDVGAVAKGQFTSTALLASENIRVGGNFRLGNYNVADFNALRIVNTTHYSSEVFQLIFSNTQTIMANGTTSFLDNGINRMIIWEFTATTADGNHYTVVRKAQTNLRSDNNTYQIEYMGFDAEFSVAIYGLR